MSSKPVACTIAGSDSGGGAGIQADIKAMEANGVYAASVITAVTAQNTQEVAGAFDLPVEMIRQQIETVVEDIAVDAFKTGMLSSEAIIRTVAACVRNLDLHPLVVDPVMISKSGYPLLQSEAIGALVGELLPLADVITPNGHEAAHLLDRDVESLEEAEAAARDLYEMGPGCVIVKGGHLAGDGRAVDVLFDGEKLYHLRSEWIESKNTHGTGCTFASSLAAGLAKGWSVPDAAREAKAYVTEAIRHGLPIGHGHGPTSHFFFLESSTQPRFHPEFTQE